MNSWKCSPLFFFCRLLSCCIEFNHSSRKAPFYYFCLPGWQLISPSKASGSGKTRGWQKELNCHTSLTLIKTPLSAGELREPDYREPDFDDLNRATPLEHPMVKMLKLGREKTQDGSGGGGGLSRNLFKGPILVLANLVGHVNVLPAQIGFPVRSKSCSRGQIHTSPWPDALLLGPSSLFFFFWRWHRKCWNLGISSQDCVSGFSIFGKCSRNITHKTLSITSSFFFFYFSIQSFELFFFFFLLL